MAAATSEDVVPNHCLVIQYTELVAFSLHRARTALLGDGERRRGRRLLSRRGRQRSVVGDLLRRTAAYQICEDDPLEDGRELIDGSDYVRMRRAFDGTLEVVIASSH